MQKKRLKKQIDKLFFKKTVYYKSNKNIKLKYIKIYLIIKLFLDLIIN